jgi:hypothetical protein
MNDNPGIIPQMVVSSELMRSTMQPSLKTIMAMRVINDNQDLQNVGKKQLGFITFFVVTSLALAYFS